MFNVVEPDNTVSYVIGGVFLVGVIVLACSLFRSSSPNDDEDHMGGILLLFCGVLFSITAVGISAYSIQKNAYSDNLINLESYFEENYSGDFKVVPPVSADEGVNRIDFSNLDGVEGQRVDVERDMGEALYVYRLYFDEDGDPALKELIAGDRADYPPLVK